MERSTFLTSAVAALLLSASNFASAADKAVLVLDGSGSMWQEVGGSTKIEIAREVIGDLMLDWSGKVELGLAAYGHREKGNCSDIETLKPIGPVDPGAVARIVGAISPKGKTPLTAAVRQAADELRYEEDRATVILVSDGEETCGGDPCAVASELEAAGIDFTVHVVGFDLTDEETANLQCIADNTGGQFFEAGNAEELHQAMAVVKEVVVEKADVARTIEGRWFINAFCADGTTKAKTLVKIRRDRDLYSSLIVGSNCPESVPYEVVEWKDGRFTAPDKVNAKKAWYRKGGYSQVSKWEPIEIQVVSNDQLQVSFETRGERTYLRDSR